MTWSNGPRLWHDILTDIGGVAVVAGGAVRDYLSGWPVKDIDVFAAAGSRFKAGEQGPHWRLMTGAETLARKDESNEYTTGIEMIHYLKYHQYDVQIIMLGYEDTSRLKNWDTEVTDRFDAGICQASYHLEKGLVVSKNYQQDVTERTYTILHGKTRDASETRAKRFVEKHPGWTIRKAWIHLDLAAPSKTEPTDWPADHPDAAHYWIPYVSRLGKPFKCGTIISGGHLISTKLSDVTCRGCKAELGLVF